MVPEANAKISVLDRGFLYGDGVYEAVRVYEGKIFRVEQHWKRLDHSLKGIGLRIPWSHQDLTRACVATLKANRLKEAMIRVTISRGAGELGYDPGTCRHPTFTVIALPIRTDLQERWRQGVKVSIVKIRRNSTRSLSPAIKHTNALNGILAKIESLKVRAFEGVFLNLDGYVAEGTISNIFIVKNGTVKTPALDCGILDGVTRHAVLEVARGSGRKILETYLKIQDVLKADEIFLTSTTMEVMPVVKVDRTVIGGGRPGPVTRSLHIAFRSLLFKELKLHG